MGDVETQIAILQTRLDNLKEAYDRRVGNLEANQKWAVLTIIALIIKAAFDLIVKGGAV